MSRLALKFRRHIAPGALPPSEGGPYAPQTDEESHEGASLQVTDTDSTSGVYGAANRRRRFPVSQFKNGHC